MTYEHSRVVFIPRCCWPSGISSFVCLLQDNFRTLDYLTNSSISGNLLVNGNVILILVKTRKWKAKGTYQHRACDRHLAVSRCSCYSHPNLCVMIYRSKSQWMVDHLHQHQWSPPFLRILAALAPGTVQKCWHPEQIASGKEERAS